MLLAYMYDKDMQLGSNSVIFRNSFRKSGPTACSHAPPIRLQHIGDLEMRFD